jgi:hypothetical protein
MDMPQQQSGILGCHNDLKASRGNGPSLASASRGRINQKKVKFHQQLLFPTQPRAQFFFPSRYMLWLLPVKKEHPVAIVQA